VLIGLAPMPPPRRVDLIAFAFCAVIALFPNIPVDAKQYDIPDIGASLSLPDSWVPVGIAVVKSYNDDMLRRRPQTTTR
jgi:hypothetical protein